MDNQTATLLDLFALSALQGLLSNPQLAKDFAKDNKSPQFVQQWHAETSYAFAKAMIAERAEHMAVQNG